MRGSRVFQTRVLGIVFCLLSGWGASLAAEKPSLIDLGGGRYQMGGILIHKPGREFVVNGKVIRDQQPIEYLAVKRAGLKSYEALFELDTTAREFNVACILIGLNNENATLPEYHFDERPVEGDPVDIYLEWEDKGRKKSFRVEELLLLDGKPVPSGEWVYTGSTLTPHGRYLAEEAGTLIGFVHDPDSIIEHRRGIGLGQYGMVEVNRSILPPVGTPIEVVVRNLGSAGTKPGQHTRGTAHDK